MLHFTSKKEPKERVTDRSLKPYVQFWTERIAHLHFYGVKLTLSTGDVGGEGVDHPS